MHRAFTHQGYYTKEAEAHALDVIETVKPLVARLVEAGFGPREAGHLIADILRDEVLLQVLNKVAGR